LQRDQLINEFLNQAGWGSAQRTALTADASTRSYERLTMQARSALLMNAPQDLDAPACHFGATQSEREALGYNACARLAGSDMGAFCAIAKGLKLAGLSAPEIYDLDADNGLAIIEDFGDDLYARVIPVQKNERLLYENAIDVLAAIHEQNVTPKAPYLAMDYDTTAQLAEIMLLAEYYWRLKKTTHMPEDLRDEYVEIWKLILSDLEVPSVFVLRDYHAENLLWLPGRSGAARTGLLDFQDGLVGHQTYDLVSLIEDARRDVDPQIVTHLKAYFCNKTGMPGECFAHEYGVLGAQRNAKILGIFARLAIRDSKMQYLDLLPRVEAHFSRNLQVPELDKLARFFDQNMPGVF